MPIPDIYSSIDIDYGSYIPLHIQHFKKKMKKYTCYQICRKWLMLLFFLMVSIQTIWAQTLTTDALKATEICDFGKGLYPILCLPTKYRRAVIVYGR